jgi:hypothetical protein
MPIDWHTRFAFRASTSCGVAPGGGIGAGGALPPFFFFSRFSRLCRAAALRFSAWSRAFCDGADDEGADGEDCEEPPECPLRFFVSCFRSAFAPRVVAGRGAVGEAGPVAPATLTVGCDDLLPPPHEASSITSAKGTNAIVRLQPVTSQAQG